MKKFNYKGFAITVFEHYNGASMFIVDASGIEIWAHKFIGDAMTQAKHIIDGQ